jgi:serine/threonine protein kinase
VFVQANFVIGTGSRAATVYCVDFGLSKRYCDPKTMRHIFQRNDRSLTGTPRYASINNHLGIEQSRRDDLESVAYILIYFLRGSLPWQGLKSNKPEQKYRLILQKKQQVTIGQLCQGLPTAFAEFLAYARSLKFDAKPDMLYLRKMFRDLYHELGCGQIVSTAPAMSDHSEAPSLHVPCVVFPLLVLCSRSSGTGIRCPARPSAPALSAAWPRTCRPRSRPTPSPTPPWRPRSSPARLRAAPTPTRSPA